MVLRVLERKCCIEGCKTPDEPVWAMPDPVDGVRAGYLCLCDRHAGVFDNAFLQPERSKRRIAMGKRRVGRAKR